MRNPVTNMVAKIALSDIPDWSVLITFLAPSLATTTAHISLKIDLVFQGSRGGRYGKLYAWHYP